MYMNSWIPFIALQYCEPFKVFPVMEILGMGPFIGHISVQKNFHTHLLLLNFLCENEIWSHSEKKIQCLHELEKNT